MVASPSGVKMASNLSCSLLVLGKWSDGVISSWMRCGKNNRNCCYLFWMYAESSGSIQTRTDNRFPDQHYLSERPLGCADLVHHPKRNADHGGECEQPANDITPPWVHILIVVLKRSVFYEGEGKSTLERKTNIIICEKNEQLIPFHILEEQNASVVVGLCRFWKAIILLSLLTLTMQVAGVKNNQQYLM